MSKIRLAAVIAAVYFTIIGGYFALAGDGRPKYELKPEVRIQIERSDRIELFAGGLHVGTLIFDPSGMAYFVGDSGPAQGVIKELIDFIDILRRAFESDKQGA